MKVFLVFLSFGVSTLSICLITYLSGLNQKWSTQILKDFLELTSSNTRMIDYWTDFPYDMTYEFYLWNITNQEEVKLGEKPILVEVGPFRYSQSVERKNYTIADDGNTVM